MSTRHPSTDDAAIEAALADGDCPHCGAGVDKSLAEHMAQDCDASAYEAPEPPQPDPEPEPDVPVLEEAPETVDPDTADLEARARLARELSRDGRTWVSE